MQKISIIGVPMDLGADRRGVDMGPSALRYADLNEKLKALGYEVQDLNDLDVIIPETHHFGDPKAKYLKEISDACNHIGSTTVGKNTPRLRRRPLDRGWNRIRSRGKLSPGRQADKTPMVRCSHGFQYARHFTERQRARHAHGRPDGLWADAADTHLRFLAKNSAGAR